MYATANEFKLHASAIACRYGGRMSVNRTKKDYVVVFVLAKLIVDYGSQVRGDPRC